MKNQNDQKGDDVKVMTYNREVVSAGILGGVWRLTGWTERWVMVSPPPPSASPGSDSVGAGQ